MDDAIPMIILGVAACVAMTGFCVAGLSGALGLIDPLSAVIYCAVSLAGAALAFIKIERAEK